MSTHEHVSTTGEVQVDPIPFKVQKCDHCAALRILDPESLAWSDWTEPRLMGPPSLFN